MGSQIYTSGSGSWQVPADVYTATIECWGGGGGGALGGGGGGGGAYSKSTWGDLVPGDYHTYAVGNGGAFGASGHPAAYSGEGTSFVEWVGRGTRQVYADYGAGGTDSGTGGQGGSSTNCIGTTKWSGGDGADKDLFGGGGGGGSAGTGEAGNDGTVGHDGAGGQAVTGGSSGGSGGGYTPPMGAPTTVGQQGVDFAAGGGGGGHYSGAADAHGGAGRNGKIVITWT